MKNLEIGQIVNTFGIKGFVKVNSWVNDVTRFDDLKKVYIKIRKSLKELEIEEVKYHKNQVLLKFKGIETVEQAEMLRNAILEIDRKDAIPLEEGEYFIADLLESEVYTDEGEKLGILEDIFNTGSNDIYVVKNELGKSILLPRIKEVFKEIDVENAIPLEKGEYFIADLLESEVFTDEGEKLGILDDIYNTGSKDIYVVKNELGKTILLPGIKDVIKEVDVENKKIIVHLIEGLI